MWPTGGMENGLQRCMSEEGIRPDPAGPLEEQGKLQPG